MTPTARSLKLLRQLGYLPEVVERWLPRVNLRRDFLGFADILAVHPRERGCLAVQCTTRGHLRDRLRKAMARPELRAWLAAGNGFEVWGWDRKGRRWQVARVPVPLDDLECDRLPVILRRKRRAPRGQGVLFREC